jgi:hypothetical protein
MELIILGLLGLIVVIIIGAVIFHRSSQSEEHVPESNEERIEINTLDGQEFLGRFRSARLIVDDKTVDFDQVRWISHYSSGMQLHLTEGQIQYPYEQLDGEISITVSGVSDPVVIPLNKVSSLFRRRFDRNA